MKKFSIWHWLVFFVVPVFIIFLVSGFVLAVVRKGAESAEAASWMQAIGSIGAIAVALAVGNLQRTSDRVLERERRHRDEIGRFEVIKAILAKTNVTVIQIAEAWNADEVANVEAITVRYLQDCKFAIAGLPVFEVPHPDLVVYLSGLPRAIDELCEVLDAAIWEQRRPQNPLGDVVAARMNVVMDFTANAGRICDREVAVRPL